jgi:hypothetical protein
MTNVSSSDGLPSGAKPALKAAAILAIPIIIADFLNYYSAGASLLVSMPALIILYLGCGALSAYFSTQSGQAHALIGAIAGFTLWGISTLINLAVAMLTGFFTLGVTLLVGVPYLCICGPFHLAGAGILGAMGAGLYVLFVGNRDETEDSSGWGV